MLLQDIDDIISAEAEETGQGLADGTGICETTNSSYPLNDPTMTPESSDTPQIQVGLEQDSPIDSLPSYLISVTSDRELSTESDSLPNGKKRRYSDDSDGPHSNAPDSNKRA